MEDQVKDLLAGGRAGHRPGGPAPRQLRLERDGFPIIHRRPDDPARRDVEGKVKGAWRGVVSVRSVKARLHGKETCGEARPVGGLLSVEI